MYRSGWQFSVFYYTLVLDLHIYRYILYIQAKSKLASVGKNKDYFGRNQNKD
jgi:hypothetical protein